MASSTTILKTVTLQPGEQFVLPPGAEFVGATSVDEIDSTCEDELEGEELLCYAFAFGNGEDDGNDSQLFESSENANVPAIGIQLNNTPFLFPAPFYANGSGMYNLTGLIAAINGTAAGTVIFNTATGVNWQGDNGVMSYIVFKTIPSIASKLNLIMTTASPNVQTLLFYIPAVPYDDVSSYTNIPACS